MIRGLKRVRAGVVLLTVAIMFQAAGCVERTIAPVDPLAAIKGTWKGTRTHLVYDSLGVLLSDTTFATDLTIVVGENAVTFIDSDAGLLPATASFMSADSMAFSLTNGLDSWTETCRRHDQVMNGSERSVSPARAAGVWAATRQ